MPKTRVAVLFGGMSEEHPIAVKSARQVAGDLNLAKYEPVYVGITTDGRWLLNDGPDTDWEREGRPATLSPDRATGGLLVQEADGWQRIPVDVVLPVFHGKYGEDGAIQGLLEFAGIPYVGCDLQSSAICIDKSLTYLMVRTVGVRTPDFWTLVDDGDVDPATLPYPVFVKPARSGSSFGVSKVEGPDGFAAAVAEARRYDWKVLIETAVSGSEVGCAVLEDGSGLITGEPDQIRLTHGFFRIHQEATPEQGSENSAFIVPAEIPAEVRERVQETAKTIYRALGCRGIARVDTFVLEDGSVVLNEVNTFPGLTSYSRYPRMMAAAGVPMAEALDRLIAFALEGARR